MKKLQYIQPKVEAYVIPADAIMDEIILSGSSTGPKVGAPRHKSEDLW